MSKYTGKPAVIDRPIDDLYNRFANLSALEDVLKNGNNKAGEVGEIKFDDNSITIVNPQVGEIRFEIVERVQPTRIVFKASKSPLPLGMTINLKSITESTTEVATVLDIELPMMVRTIVGPKLQQVADKFGETMAQLGK
ncbi:MAG: hypothetical protein NC082_08060 [Clostridiales bacterium]|nr:hypothetical protein [Clostridiales bacterium]